jgi:transposase
MKTLATRNGQDSGQKAVLYMAFELGESKWILRFGDGGTRTRDIRMEARDLDRLELEIARAKERFQLPRDVRVVSCYEAGRDGFWLHRYLVSQGVENLVVDSASIEVSRRRRRAKTDRLDVTKLHAMLIRHVCGERVWSVVHVPDVEAEDARQIHRELQRMKGEARRHRNRIQSLLVTQGISVGVGRGFREHLEEVELWDGTELPEYLKGAVLREYERLELVQRQIRELEALRRRMVKEQATAALAKVFSMMQLRGIGLQSSWVFVMEFFGWRDFGNRREVASLAGLAPTPYNSGGSDREQGIGKAGNGLVRWMTVEIAWGWLRFQPESQLSQWYRERFAGGGSRMRRVGIVALARKLLIALWRFVEYGEVPEGARLKAA